MFLKNKIHDSSCISSRMFEKNASKHTRIFAQEPGNISGHCGGNKHWGLAVLVGLIVKLSL